MYFQGKKHFKNNGCVKKINSTQKFKLLDEVPMHDLYYSFTHPFK
jgi:hypothetical protein